MNIDLNKIFSINFSKTWQVTKPLINAKLKKHIPEIDHEYVFDEELTRAILAAIIFNSKIFINGLHGTGKSSHIEQIAARLGWPVIRLNLDGQISRFDLLGKDAIKIKNGQQITEFEPGILPYAIEKPYILILDELDAAKGDVLFVLQKMLEENGSLFIPDKNIFIKPHKSFRIFATANNIGFGDNIGIYHGVNPINQALLDRFDIFYKMNFLDLNSESKLLSNKFPKCDFEQIEKLSKFAALSRSSFQNSDISNFISIRNLIAIMKNFLIFNDLKKSIELSFLNRLPEEEHQQIKEHYQRCFGNNF